VTNRELVIACLHREPGPVPQWNMGFFNGSVAEEMAPGLIYPSYPFVPAAERYSYGPLDDEEREAVIRYNHGVGKCAIGVGRGANSSFGHGGPGEFGCRVEDRGENWFTALYETGARHYYQLRPHYYHVSDVPIKQSEDIRNLGLPDAADPDRFAGFAQDVQYFKGRGEFTYGNINGFFSGLHYYLMEYQNALMGFLLDPEGTRELVRMLGQWNLTAAEKMLDAGVDCIALCDDLGTGDSMLISPATYREFIKPWHVKLNQLVQSHEGRYTHLHSHGKIDAILPDIVEAGFDILNPLDPSDGMDLVEVKKRFGGRIVPAGGLDKMFFDWDPARQRENTAKLISLGREAGGYMLMEPCGMPDTITVTQWRTFLELSREIRYSGHEGEAAE
jgi:uroporphyrinogen decarboxylase